MGTGATITTIEGLEANGELDAIQKALHSIRRRPVRILYAGRDPSAQSRAQCPPRPTEAQINDGMAGVLAAARAVKVKEAIRNDHLLREERKHGDGT